MSSPQLMIGVKEGRLFGRDREIQQIQNAAKRSKTGTEIVLLHGESGAGKTRLVREALLNQKDNMISGKFDVMKITRPYSAIVDALADLCHKKRDERKDEFISEFIDQISPSDVAMLSKLVPPLEILLKSKSRFINRDAKSDESFAETLGVITTPDIPNKRRGSHAFARFAEVLRLFLRLACDVNEELLILFLDDIQWADAASMALIASLASHADELHNLLIILAFREGDEYGVTPDKILSDTASLPVNDILLSRLDHNGLNGIVAEVLQMNPEDTMGLTGIILQRTGGNIYFCRQFLEMLQRESLLTFSFQHVRWEWDEKQIQAGTDVTDNVAALLTAKIQQLPKDLQSILQLAACLGFYFNIEFLDKLAKSEGIGATRSSLGDEKSEEKKEDESNFFELLDLGYKESLIERVGESSNYRFTHDRVQQAAYEMIPPGRDRDMLHWRIGQLLLKEQQVCRTIESTAPGDDWILFAAADQLNRGSSVAQELAVTEAERLALVDLNIQAGKKAVEKSAFLYGEFFFDEAIQRLGSRWHVEYYLCLELYTLSAQAAYAVSNFVSCAQRVDTILANARSIEDKFPAYVVLVQSLIVRQKLGEAINLAVNVLNQLGECIPRNPSTLRLLWEMAKAKRALKGRKLSELVVQPPMTDPRKLIVMELLCSLSTAAWFSSETKIMAFAFSRMPRLTFTFGICQHSPFSMTLHGLLLGIMGDYENAYESGQVALELLKRLPSKAYHAQTTNVAFCFLKHLKEPLTRSLDPLLESYHTGLEMGEAEAAAIGLFAYGCLSAYLGKKLGIVVKEFEGFRETYKEDYKENFMMILMIVIHQFALNLLGRSNDPLVLTGECMNEEVYLRETIESRNFSGESTVYMYRMMLLYIMCDVEGALKELNKLKYELVAKGTHFSFYFTCTYAGLVLLARARESRKQKYIRRAERYIGIMTKFAKCGSVNAPPFVCLLLAEKTSLNRRSSIDEVKTAYNKAISLAARCGFNLIEAIAQERAGEYFFYRGDMFWAETYLSRALMLYSEWGAVAKTNQMKRKYPFLEVSGISSARSIASSSSVTMRARFAHKASRKRSFIKGL